MAVLDFEDRKKRAERLVRLEAVVTAAKELIRAGAVGQGIDFQAAYVELKRQLFELNRFEAKPPLPWR